MFWNLSLHINPFPFIQCSYLDLLNTLPSTFKLLTTSILTTVKEFSQPYHNVCYFRSGINSMWILKIWKQLLLDNRNIRASRPMNFQPYRLLFSIPFAIPTQKKKYIPKNVFSICWDFLFTAYLSCVVDVFFNSRITIGTNWSLTKTLWFQLSF